MLCSIIAKGTEIGEVHSPNGRICVKVNISKEGEISFESELDNDTLVTKSPLGIIFKSDTLNFTSGLKFLDSSKCQIAKRYEMPTGKQRLRSYTCNEKEFKFYNSYDVPVSIIFRVFDDAIAFRYRIANSSETSVISELSGFNMNNVKSLWVQEFKHNDENEFIKIEKNEMIQNKSLSFPVLAENQKGKVLLITESDVRNFPISGGRITGSKVGFAFMGTKHAVNTVESNFESPWRVMIVGTDYSTIVKSCVVDHLAEETEIEDLSWIKPGLNAFPWWSNPDAHNHPEKLKEYIDLAAEMRWPYIEFDLSIIGNKVRSMNVWRTTPWIQEVIAYAKSKGIGCFGWEEIRMLEQNQEQREEFFRTYQKLGMVGCKVDFIGSYGQQRCKAVEEIARTAAKYHMMVSFHGAPSPRGLARTYPNIVTVEGVKGAEHYISLNNAIGISTQHNCMLPFTRNVLGSMDYTPVSFTAKNRTTTMAHELALPIVFESGWQGLGDFPEAYLKSPAKFLFTQLPASWDETILLAGYPGEYCVFARRKGEKWYIAGINAAEDRTLTLNLSELDIPSQIVSFFTDSQKDEDSIVKESLIIEDCKMMDIKMKGNGGFAFIASVNKDSQ